MSIFLKDYEKKVLELENKNLKKEIDELKTRIWDFEHMECRFKHLMESEFIKSFSMYTGNGQWQRPIAEADQVAYGKGLINATLPPSDGGVMELQRRIKEDYTRNERVIKMLEPTEQPDAINPSHYKECSLECIDAMLMAFGADHVYMFCCITAWKYMWRYENKNGIEDIGKARWYIEKAKELGHDQPEVWNLEYVLEKIEKVKGILLC